MFKPKQESTRKVKTALEKLAGLKIAAVASMFLLPSILLGTVSPYAIKLKAKSLERIGSTSGNLYALATLGSVLGTFLTTFILLMVIPLTAIFVGLAACLLAVTVVLDTGAFTSALSLTGFSRKKLAYAVTCIAIILAIIMLFPGMETGSNGLATLSTGNEAAPTALVYVSDTNVLPESGIDISFENTACLSHTVMMQECL